MTIVTHRIQIIFNHAQLGNVEKAQQLGAALAPESANPAFSSKSKFLDPILKGSERNPQNLSCLLPVASHLR